MIAWPGSSITSWCSSRRTTPPTTTSPRCGRGARTWPPAGRPSPTRPRRPAPYPRRLRQVAARPAGGTGPRPRTPSSTPTAVLPFYAYLATTGAFLENHCSGFGTNSTPNHLLIVGGQTPTLRNPPRNQPTPVWDMPSLPGHAADHGLSWKVYTGTSGYPVRFYTQLNGLAEHRRAATTSSPTPPTHPARAVDGVARHPLRRAPARRRHPGPGQDLAGRRRHRHRRAWDTTVFLLTWDDWGGFDDHVVTPNLEHTPDGVQLGLRATGAAADVRRPGPGRIDSRWNAHISIGKTVLDLLGLPAARRAPPRRRTQPRRPRRPDRCTLRPPPALRHHDHPTRRRPTRHPTPAPAPPPPARRPRSRSARSCSATAPPCPRPTINQSTHRTGPARGRYRFSKS